MAQSNTFSSLIQQPICSDLQSDERTTLNLQSSFPKRPLAINALESPLSGLNSFVNMPAYTSLCAKPPRAAFVRLLVSVSVSPHICSGKRID
jgi:hypothetical protein